MKGVFESLCIKPARILKKKEEWNPTGKNVFNEGINTSAAFLLMDMMIRGL